MTAARPPVLLVDDQKKLAILVAQLLNRLGFPETHIASNGDDALAMLKVSKYSLVISDLDLEPMDGLRLLQHVRNNPDTASLPFIIAETDFHHDDIRQSLGLGADGILLKPYEVPLLRSKISYALSPRARVRRKEATTSQEPGLADLFNAQMRLQDGRARP